VAAAATLVIRCRTLVVDAGGHGHPWSPHFFELGGHHPRWPHPRAQALMRVGCGMRFARKIPETLSVMKGSCTVDVTVAVLGLLRTAYLSGAHR